MSSRINVVSSVRARRAWRSALARDERAERGWSSLPWRAAAPLVVILSGLLIWLPAGGWLGSSFAAIGMSLDQGRLLASLTTVGVASAIGAALVRRHGVRSAALVLLLAIEVIPTLWSALVSLRRPGVLIEHPDLLQWFLQPVGILMLGALVAAIGCGTGTLLRRDIIRLAELLSIRPSFMAALVIGAVLAAAGGPAAVSALQAGPRTQLIGVSADTSGGAGRLEHMTIADHEALVYVPAVHDRSPALRLPVLYLLHGFPASPSDWTGDGQVTGILDQVINSGALPPVFAVMPDGNGDPVSDSEWANTAAGDRVESWVVNDLVPAITRAYPTLSSSCTGIAGYSSGGFGAINLAMRHPSLFSWAGSYSGYFVGPLETFGAAQLANSPLWSAQRLAPGDRMPLFLGAGASDPTFTGTTRAFAAALGKLKWPDVKVYEVAGAHGWGAWRPLMVASLTWLGQLWTGTSAMPGHHGCAPSYD
jgi:enterochelin esterase-like enzyme